MRNRNLFGVILTTLLGSCPACDKKADAVNSLVEKIKLVEVKADLAFSPSDGIGLSFGYYKNKEVKLKYEEGLLTLHLYDDNNDGKIDRTGLDFDLDTAQKLYEKYDSLGGYRASVIYQGLEKQIDDGEEME